MTRGAGIDFGNIVATTDLAALIERDLGSRPDRSGRWVCPFHDDHSPSMGLTPDRRRFKCFVCGSTGTAVDWIMHRDGVGVVEAARLLDSTIPESKRRRTSRLVEAKPLVAIVEESKPLQAWQSDQWQDAADRIIRDAESRLWSTEGDDAREWLYRRGFQDHTIQRFRLGFVPDKTTSRPVEALGLNRYGKPQGLLADRGIIVPRLAPESWYTLNQEPDGPRWSGAKIRRLMPEVFASWDKAGGAKFRSFTGTAPGFLFPYDDPASGVPCLIAEGEMDALLAFQHVGHMVNVATTAGATQCPEPMALAALRTCGDILIATDFDQAGEKSAGEWRARFPGRAKRLYLPNGKDITEFVTGGGNLVQWLRSEFKRLS